MNTLRRIFNFFYSEIWNYDTSITGKTIKSKLTVWLKTAMLTARVFIKEDMFARDIPALTFSTFMAMVPLLAMLFVLGQGLGCDVMFNEWVRTALKAQPQVADTILEFVNNYIANVKGQYIVSISLLFTFYTLFSLMQKIESVFNRIWHVKERPLRRMLTEYTAMFMFFTVMIFLSSTLNVVGVSFIQTAEEYFGIGEILNTIVQIAAFIPISLFLFFFYITIPNTYVNWRNAVVPGIIAGVLVSLLQYYYLWIQVWLSSYNIIYGSFAALPLFVLWLEWSWTICIIGAMLSCTIQNIHHYDCDVDFADVAYEKQISIYAILMQRICLQFKNGDKAFTARELQKSTGIPQQFINSALDRLLAANLVVQIRSNKRGNEESYTQYHPSQAISNLTYGKMIENLEHTGFLLEGLDLNKNRTENWEAIHALRDRYITDGKEIELSTL